MKRHCWCWLCWIETNQCFFIEHLLRLSSSPAQSWSRGTPEIWTQPRLRLGFCQPRINSNDFATHEWTFNISCAFSEWRTRLVASTLSYERVKSLNILEDGMAPSPFCLLYVSAMQTHKGQSLKHEAFARSKGKSLPSQPLESLWTSVQKRMVWTSPLWSEIDLDWFCSRFASVVQVRAARQRLEVNDWKQRTGTSYSYKWQVHTSRRRRSWTGLLCLRHVLYVKGFGMVGGMTIYHTRTLTMAPIRLYTWSILKWMHCIK